MKPHKPIPPKIAQKILLRFLRDDLAEEVLGDLDEKFYVTLKTKSLFSARMNYWYQIFNYLRPFAIRKSKPSSSNHYAMYRSYFKIGYRNLLKNKGYSFINISGLSIGIASSLLIFLIVRQEYSFDKFHTKADRIYRMETTKVERGDTFAGTPTGVLAPLRNDFQGIEKVGAVVQEQGKIIDIEQGPSVDKYKESVVFVENELFHILDFQWLRGNPDIELNDLNTIILSESYAQKFFGLSDNALGKHIHFDEQDWMVTGIVADPPDNTDFPFHIMASYANIKKANTQYDQQHWSWGDNHQTFILLKTGVSAQEVALQFPRMIEKYMGKEALTKRAYSLLPLNEIHFAYNYGGRSANPKMLKTLVIVGLFLLLIACANFINLATAQGIRRSREVGVRKAFGSSRLQLIHQFLSEAGFITLLALVLSFIEGYLILPYISQLLGITISTDLIWSIPSIIFSVSVVIVTALLAGFYPALIVSAMRPVGAMKEAIANRLVRGISLRNSLIVFQFCISLVLIIGTLTIGQQIQLFKNANLGFDYESVITADIPQAEFSKLEVIRHELLASPFIQNVSFSNNSPSSERNWMGVTQYNRAGEVIEINTQMKMVDNHFIDTYNINLLAGEQFQEGDTLPKGVINEVMANRMGFTDPKDAIGQMISSGESSFPVIGVVKNFHVNSLHQKIDPTLMFVRLNDVHQVGIKLHQSALTAENLKKTIAHFKQVWTSAFPEQIFAYQFLDQTLEEAYFKEIQTSRLIHLATTIAIFISCLGLFGLVVFTSEQRVKEVGIRKVLGASVVSIFTLFTKDYLKLILIANAFAWPISWWIMREWLEGFEYSTEVSWWIFAVAALAIIVIAGLTISTQVIKAATVNPVKSLRSE